MSLSFFDRIKESQRNLFKKPLFGFYLVMGEGEGLIILIKKSPLLFLFRMIFFMEFNIFVLSQKSTPIFYNRIDLAEQFLMGNIRYNSHVSWVTFKNMGKDDYEKYWLKNGYSPEDLKNDKSIDVWPSPYHQQFHIESPTSSRKIIPFWTP
jgi:hypothetical protein